MVQETKKDMQELIIRQDTILDRNLFSNEIVNFRGFQEKIRVANRPGQRKGGKVLDKGRFSTGETRSQINKLLCVVPRWPYTKKNNNNKQLNKTR